MFDQKRTHIKHKSQSKHFATMITTRLLLSFALVTSTMGASGVHSPRASEEGPDDFRSAMNALTAAFRTCGALAVPGLGRVPCGIDYLARDENFGSALDVDFLTVTILQFAMYADEAKRTFTADLKLGLAHLYHGHEAGYVQRSGIEVTGAGSAHLNGWYGRRDASEGPPSSIRNTKGWITHETWMRDSEGRPWYQKDDGCHIYFDSSSSMIEWYCADPDGKIYYGCDVDYARWRDIPIPEDHPPVDEWSIYIPSSSIAGGEDPEYPIPTVTFRPVS